MSRSECKYLPFLVYTAVLVVLWLASWFVGVAALFVSSEGALNNLFSAEGIRWALCNALPAINGAPWGEAALLIASIGLLNGSGMPSSLMDICMARPLTIIRRQAALAAVVVFVLSLLLLFLCSFAPWRILSGVTDSWATSALVQGWLSVLLVVSFLVSAIHGTVCGNYRSFTDVLNALFALFSFFVPALFAFLPASGIVHCMRYVGVISIDDRVAALLTDVLCWLSFLYLVVIEGCFAFKRYKADNIKERS